MNRKFSEIIFKEYLETVEKSGVLNAYRGEEIKDENEFAAKLVNCSIVAQKEFISCHDEIVKIFNGIIEIDKEINNDIENIKNKHSTYADNWRGIFDEFNLRLTDIFIYSSEKLIGSFEEKIKRMDNFTICLFGRTKVGKSTTMEALTKGKGETIGIGKQNTTVDVKEYGWKNLKVIDTPGIDAMHEIDQLEELAVEFADNSDLIAFLMPHQIEEGDFQKFKLFYQQKKPIIIILNVKESTGKLGTKDMEMFIKNSDKIFEVNKIQGYKDRINDYILETLGIEKDLIPIIPIHADAAFTSNNIPNKELSEKLYGISNFPMLETILMREVTEYGELYRIKNPHETVKLFSNKINDALSNFNLYLTEQQAVFHTNIEKFKVVKNKLIQRENAIIQSTIEIFFNNKLNGVGFIVNQLFETKKEADRKKILNNFVNESQLQNQFDKTKIEIQKVIKREVQEYFDAFSKELELVHLRFGKTNFNYSTNKKIQDLDSNKFRNNFVQGASAFTSAAGGLVFGIMAIKGGIAGAAGTLFGVGGANIWNPVGWVLIGSGAILSIAGVIFAKKRRKKIAEAKINAIKDLKKEINKIKINIISKIRESNTEVIKQIKEDHIDVLNEYLSYSKKYHSKIKYLITSIEDISLNSEKNKYQAMLDNFSNSDSYKVQDVCHTDRNISIQLNELPKNLDAIQDVFSRVEEKQVLILKA